MNPETQRILAENGVDKIHYYFINSPIVNNAFTACVLVNSEQQRIEARGVSICSLLDTFCKSEGKNKAFGRAVKALVRRKNNWKINGSSRDDEFTQRSFKVKTQADDDRFRSEVAPELRKIDPQLPVTVSQNGKGKKYTFEVPLSYPVRLANSMFRYKSQYRPTPVNEEERDLVSSIEIFSHPIIDEEQNSAGC